MTTEKETLEKVLVIEKVLEGLRTEREKISNKIDSNGREIYKLNEALKNEVALYPVGTKFIKDNVEELTIGRSELHWGQDNKYVIDYQVKGRDNTQYYKEQNITDRLYDKSWKVRAKGDFALGKSIMIKKLGKTGEHYYGVTHKGTMLIFEDVYGNLDATMGDGNYRLIQNKHRDSWRLVRVKTKAELEAEAAGSQSWRRRRKTVTVSWRLTIKQSCVSKEDQVEHLL
jgi:hypothetical protein